MYSPDFVLFHHPCSDGITAAAVVHKFYSDTDHEPEFIAADYAAVGDVDAMIEKYRDKHILLVDFSFKKKVIEALQQVTASIVIIDHHKTALADLEDFQVYELEGTENTIVDVDVNNVLETIGKQVVVAVFDMKESGASLTYKFFNPSKEVPIFVRYVKDIDIAQHKLPRFKDFQWYSRSLPFDVKVMAKQIDVTKDDLEKNFDDGAAIFKFVTTRLNVLKDNVLEGNMGGKTFGYLVTDYALASEMANFIVQEMGFDFGVCGYFSKAGMGFSLRSIAPLDVSAIAKEFGGGGHAQAAGFNLKFNEVGGFLDSLMDGGHIDDLYAN